METEHCVIPLECPLTQLKSIASTGQAVPIIMMWWVACRCRMWSIHCH